MGGNNKKMVVYRRRKWSGIRGEVSRSGGEDVVLGAYLWSNEYLIEFGRALGLSLQVNISHIRKYLLGMRSTASSDGVYLMYCLLCLGDYC